MKVITLLTLLLLCIKLPAQTLEKDIIGKWAIIKVHYDKTDDMTKDDERLLDNIAGNLLNSVFQFNADKTFSTTMDFGPEMKMNKGYWTINEGMISLAETAGSKSILMDISVKANKGKTFFLLEESPFILEMQKK
jgi:hypothetical protein